MALLLNQVLKKVKTAAKTGKIKVGSVALISNQRKWPTFRNSTRLKAWNKAIKTGICTSNGKKAEEVLTPFFLCRGPAFLLTCECGFPNPSQDTWPGFLFTSGWISCILREEVIWYWKTGKRMVRIKRVKRIIPTPMFPPIERKRMTSAKK